MRLLKMPILVPATNKEDQYALPEEKFAAINPEMIESVEEIFFYDPRHMTNGIRGARPCRRVTMQTGRKWITPVEFGMFELLVEEQFEELK